MEEQAHENMETMDLKHNRKLNFNAPFLSTRRLGFSVSMIKVADTSCSSNSLGTLPITSVPFSWEQAPGKPKGMERSDSDSILGGDTPRPRPPPRLWHPPKAEPKADVSNNVLAFDQDDGCDGDDDNDDGDDEKKNAVYNNAMDDVLSLSEALDIVQQSETSHSGIHDGDLSLKLAGSNNGDQSPTYMINRFLNDATALAASSAVQFSVDFSKKVCEYCDRCSYPEAYLSGSARHSCASSSPKGCGLEILFPWRMRHKLCAIKSPVLTNLKKNQHSSKNMNMKHCSSVHHITGHVKM